MYLPTGLDTGPTNRELPTREIGGGHIGVKKHPVPRLELSQSESLVIVSVNSSSGCSCALCKEVQFRADLLRVVI